MKENIEKENQIMADPRNTWVAIATKIGGQIVWIGGEFTDGTMVNLLNTNWRYEFQINSFRTGPGLGLSAGYIAVFFFNMTSPSQVDGISVEDWGFNLAILGKWKEILKTFKNLELYTTVGKIGVNMAIGLHDLDVFRNAAHTISTAFDIAKYSNIPKIVTLDLPAGVGAEVSFVDIYGKVNITKNESVRSSRR